MEAYPMTPHHLFGQQRIPMSRTPLHCLVAVALLAVHVSAWADGFRLTWARENEPHIVMQLSPDQVAAVGRERKLLLTQSQRETLAKFTKKVPPVLGVESLGEPDCSCHHERPVE